MTGRYGAAHAPVLAAALLATGMAPDVASALTVRLMSGSAIGMASTFEKDPNAPRTVFEKAGPDSSLESVFVASEVAPDRVETTRGLLTELKAKATAASDESATLAMRTSYNDEFQSLLKSIQSFADNAIFDGSNILDGSATAGINFLASADGTETITLNRQDMTLNGLGLGTTPAAPDLLTKANADAALTRINTALATSTANLAELGAQAKQIERHTTYVGKLSDALEAGIGNLVDADLAKESARLQALQVQQQLGVQALSIANQSPQIILSLFKG